MVELGRLGRPAIPTLRRLATVTPQLPDLEAFLADPYLADVAVVHTTNITLDFALIRLCAGQGGVVCPTFVPPSCIWANREVSRWYATMRCHISLICCGRQPGWRR